MSDIQKEAIRDNSLSSVLRKKWYVYNYQTQLYKLMPLQFQGGAVTTLKCVF